MVHLEGLRQAIHTAAEQLRALSDDELVALALKASPTRSLREEIEHEKRTKPARKAKPLPRGPKPEPAKPAGSTGGQQILDALASCPDGMTAGELAKKLRRSAKGLGGGLGKMQTAGSVRRLDDGRWVVVGRQAGARKTARPVRSSDEEEGGAPVKLSVAAPIPPAPRRSVSLPIVDGEAEPNPTAKWKPAPVLHDVPNVPAVLAPPVEPEQVSAPSDRIRCLPCRSTIFAGACIERQKIAGAYAKQKTGPGSGRLSGAEITARMGRGEYSSCVGCEIGACVRRRLAS